LRIARQERAYTRTILTKKGTATGSPIPSEPGSLQFVYSMLKGLGKATEDHSQTYGFSPGSPDEDAFNAALAVIDGVRPKDEIEAMLAAHMAVTNIALLELVAVLAQAVAGRGRQVLRLRTAQRTLTWPVCHAVKSSIANRLF
jgi:hypothetical protein